ncbi:MAG: Ig-like domain-containing protein, partial [Thermoguttaceae bacterium]
MERLEDRHLLSAAPSLFPHLVTVAPAVPTPLQIHSAGILPAVKAANTTVKIKSSLPTGVEFGQPVSFTIRVTSGSGTPTGSVGLLVDQKLYGSAAPLTLGTATITVTNLA